MYTQTQMLTYFNHTFTERKSLEAQCLLKCDPRNLCKCDGVARHSTKNMFETFKYQPVRNSNVLHISLDAIYEDLLQKHKGLYLNNKAYYMKILYELHHKTLLLLMSSKLQGDNFLKIFQKFVCEGFSISRNCSPLLFV